MVVVNNTELNKDEAISLLCKATKSNYVKKYLLSIVLIVCGIPVTIIGIVDKQSFQLTMGCLFIAVSIAYAIINTISIIKLPKYVIEKNKDICTNGVKYEYKFKEQSINIVCKSLDKTNKITYKYDDVKKVIEEEDKYIVHLKEYQIFYVYKSGFENKKMEEFFIKNLKINKKKIKYLNK